MARDPQLNAKIRRRRLVALLLFAIAVAAAVGVSFNAIRHRIDRATTTQTQLLGPQTFHVIFPEGFTREQMIERVGAVAAIARGKSTAPVLLNASGYAKQSTEAQIPCFGGATQSNLEGFLFPSTYEFLADTTSRRLVRQQLQTFCRRWRGVDLGYARSKNLTSYDVLIIASMVEREAAAPGDRALIAAVIYNRLHNHMTLGIDATLRYGLHIPATESITNAQLASDNPYNTRKLFGLPPTPIANPGIASIEAAAHPAQVGYLYFVRKPDHRHHFFTASSTEFQQYLAAHGYG